MDSSRLTQPWYRHSAMYAAPNCVLLKLDLGETPEAIPALRDARIGAQQYARKVDVGAVDSVLSRYASEYRVARLHGAAAMSHKPGQRNRRYNDMEQNFGLARTLRIEVPEDCNVGYLLNALRPLAVVEQASPHYLSTLPFDTAVAAQAIDVEAAWAPRDCIQAAEAEAYQAGDPAVITAVVDTGVALQHQELQGLMKPGFDSVMLGTTTLPAGIQLVGDATQVDADPEDMVGHGTSCMAIIGGAGRLIPPGLANGTTLVPVRSLASALFPGRPDPVGIGGCADIDMGLKMAVDLGAKVINCSFGSPIADLEPGEAVPHRDVVQYALAHGCILVAASGNSGKEQQFSPAALDGVIAVGACTQEGVPTGFSTSGEHVALCAPGERVLSASLNGYSLVTGTSFAAPFVAATCALLVARALCRSFPIDGATARTVLTSSAVPFSPAVRGHHGAGVLNALAALKRLDSFIDDAEEAEFMSSERGTEPQGGMRIAPDG
jgi:subtilisin family serine protease